MRDWLTMSVKDQGTTEARLEFWRRASFALISVIIAGLGLFFGVLWNQVQDNRGSIAGLHKEIASLSELVMVNTRAQRDTTTQLAALTGQLDVLLLLDLPQERQE